MRDELSPGAEAGSSRDLERRSRALGEPRSASPLPPGDDRFLEGDLRFYWNVLRRRWRLVAGTVLVLVVGTAVATLLTPPTYRASGLLEIRRGDAEMEGQENLFRQQNVSEEYLQTQYGILESKAVARQVVESLRLDTLPSMAPEPEDGGDQSLQALVEKVQRGLEVDPREGSRLVRLSYETGDPQLSADVVNAALNGYVDVRVQAGQEVVSWLSGQVDSTKAELRESERELRAYARDHDLPVLETGDGGTRNVVDQRLGQLEDAITAARAARIEAESRYREVASGEGAGSVENQAIQDLVVDLAALRQEYARLSTVFQESYPKAREVREQIEELERELERERARVAGRLESEYRAARRQERLLQEAADEQRELGRRMADESGQYRLLRREIETTRDLLAAFQQTLKEAEVSAALREARFGIVDLAAPPRSPVGSGMAQNLALALIAGLILGVGGAFVRERFESPIPAASAGVSRPATAVLEIIPGSGGDGRRSLRSRRRHARKGIPSSPGPSSPGDESERGRGLAFAADRGGEPPADFGLDATTSFEALRDELFRDDDAAAPRSLLVTSCQPREGSTTVSTNLARVLAASGRRTLLVDADLRRPALHPSSIEGTPGLWEHLTEGTAWHSLVRDHPEEGFDVLPAGCADGEVTEALASSRMQSFLSEAEGVYDCVIVDSAALFVDAPDARILFRFVDCVLVVARRGVTPRALVRRVVDVAPNVLGVVLSHSTDADLEHPVARPGSPEPRDNGGPPTGTDPGESDGVGSELTVDAPATAGAAGDRSPGSP